MKLSWRKFGVGIVLGAVLVMGMMGASDFKKTHKQAILQSDLVQRMVPLYRSLRKLPDVLFMPWAAFTKSELETFELTISPQNIERMNAALPEAPFNSSMDEDSKLWVSGYFRTSDYEGNVDVRYRGNLAAHWNAYQKSYKIEFPKNNLFRGMREINVIIPSKRRYLGMSLNDYRADKLELIHPDEQLVRFEVNGANMGVMLAFESWSQPWIEKMPISALSTIYGVDEGAGTYRERWDSWNAEDPIDFTPLEALEEIVEHAPDEEFAKLIPQLIDIEDWYNWDTMRILASGYHVSSGTSFGANNLVIVFDRSEGRFKPVPYNTVIYTEDYREKANTEGVRGMPTRLYRRILSIPEFRARRDALWEAYKEREMQADMEYLAWWRDTYDREFLLDNAKNDNHFMYLAKITEYVTGAEAHFADPFNILNIEYEVEIEPKEKLELPETFADLPRATMSATEAAAQHISLQVVADGLYIGPGRHRFPETIVIPANQTLTVAPGATLLFAEDASLISYSPVSAVSSFSESDPITIGGYTPDTRWGVFAVINASGTSTMSGIAISGGGETTVNGAFISGTLAFHNSDVELTNSVIAGAKGDDGFNVKGARVIMTGNQFIGNSSDGVDLDYVDENSVIEQNTFVNNYGDSLDISWSAITINDNTIDTCVDKGISVGERSELYILNNTISNCQMGIAVKDGSVATIEANIFNTNHTAIAAYQKKPYFTGGTVTMFYNTLENNTRSKFLDAASTITWE